jgi:PhzF family phenazine biosynthesis protein
MPTYSYRIVNVFADSPLSGNPLAVFEDAHGMHKTTMQALALQFNLSETTFILPSTVATRRVRIFTPAEELPFAGHPTLGTAHVVRSLDGTGDTVSLEMLKTIKHVEAAGDVWTFKADPPKPRPPTASNEELARMIGLSKTDLADAPPLWVDTGIEQLVIPLGSFDAVNRAKPDAVLLHRHGRNADRVMVYIFARVDDHVLARFFFSMQDSSFVEDAGTGSAGANLGGWLLVTDAALPQRLVIDQGAMVGRPSRLDLAIAEDSEISVSGRVIELGRGTITF